MAELLVAIVTVSVNKLAFSVLQEISLPLDFKNINRELKKLKDTISTIEAVLPDAEEMQKNKAALRIWLTKLEVVFLNARSLLHEIECQVQLRSQGSVGQKLCCFFSSSNQLVFRSRIRHRIKKMRESIDEIAAERKTTYSFIPASEDSGYICASEDIGLDEDPEIKKTREMVLEIFAKIDKLNLNVTYSFFRSHFLDEDRAKQIVYIVGCIVAVCMDPFFLYIPFLSRIKMCLGMNRDLWLVAVVVRTVADLSTAQILLNMSIKSILLMCVKYLALAPIPQILFSEKFILKTLRGYTFWNLSLFCQYGIRLVLIFLACEQLKTRVSIRTLVWFNAPVYLFLYLIVSHVIGASWYYRSIKRQLSCWHHVCKIDTGCIFHCDGTTTSTLNSTLYNEFCPINPPNTAVFDYGIYLDALQSHIVEEEGVLKKFLRCFFWGLRNLSSFASNLQTSTNGGETFFAIIISAVALILLIYIIGNIQRYTELESARSEKIVYKMKPIKERIKLLGEMHKLGKSRDNLIVEHIQEALETGTNKLGIYKSFNLESLHINDGTNKESLEKDLQILETSILDPEGKAEKWLSDNIPLPHRNNILFYMKCKLEDNQDVNLKSVLSVLPFKHEWMTKKDLCFDTLKKVPGLQNIDEIWFRKISINLEPVMYTKESRIFQQGKPLDFIIFITNGIATSTDAGGRVSLEKGHFFGAELIKWKLDKINESESDTIPICTADVKSNTQVEAFVLTTKYLASCSDFPIATSKLRRMIRKQIMLNAFTPKRSADSAATEGVDSSSRTEEGASVQRNEEAASVQREIEEV